MRERAAHLHRCGPFGFAQAPQYYGADGEADGVDGEGHPEADVDGEQGRDRRDEDLGGDRGGPDTAVRGDDLVAVDDGGQQRLRRG